MTGRGQAHRGGEHAQDDLWRSREYQVGMVGRTGSGPDPAVDGLDDCGTVARVQFDRHRWIVGRRVAEKLRDGEGEPVTAEGVVICRLGHARGTPDAERRSTG